MKCIYYKLPIPLFFLLFVLSCTREATTAALYNSAAPFEEKPILLLSGDGTSSGSASREYVLASKSQHFVRDSPATSRARKTRYESDNRPNPGISIF